MILVYTDFTVYVPVKLETPFCTWRNSRESHAIFCDFLKVYLESATFDGLGFEG